jgi:hypothetical protein
MDINLSTNKQRTYGNVIEDLLALILLANCGVSTSGDPAVPDDPSTRDALCAAAKSMLIYEKMHIRKFYLQHLLWTVPHQDLVIYNYDYYDRYKYNAGRSSPAMPIQDYVNMRHQKKMQDYLCECELSWSYVFTGVVQSPENVEDTTRLPTHVSHSALIQSHCIGIIRTFCDALQASLAKDTSLSCPPRKICV